MSDLFQRVRVEIRPIGTSGITETFETPPEVVRAKLVSTRVFLGSLDAGPASRLVELTWLETVR